MVGAVRSNDPGGRFARRPCQRNGAVGGHWRGRARTPTHAMGMLPSGPRVGVFTRCMTGSGGVTSCGRRGGGCKRNRGAAGVDRLTLAAVEEYGVERMLGELAVRASSGVVSPRAGPAGGDPQARWRQQAAGHPDGPRSGRPAGGAAGAGADLRGRLSWRSRTGFGRGGRRRTPRSASASAFPRGSGRGSRGRHPRLLRHDRPATLAGAGRRAGLGSAGAQAACASGSRRV